MQSEIAKILWSFSRPLHLLFAALTYVLGISLAQYLGHALDALFFWLGFGWLSLLLLATAWLEAHFRSDAELQVDGVSILQLRRWLLQGSAALLTLVGAASVVLFAAGRIDFVLVVLMGLLFLLLVAYALPPLRLSYSGFGELAMSLVLSMLTPAFSYALQTAELTRILFLLGLPIAFVMLATLLTLNFESFVADQKYKRNTLLTRLTWKQAVPFHHGLIFLGYALFAFAATTGLPWGLILPAFLTLPLSFLQIFWLRNISLGRKPFWKLLKSNAIALTSLTVYMLVLTFWMR